MKNILLASVVCLLLLCGCSSSESSSQSKVAKEGDVVKIDFVGKLDGVAFDGGTASGQIVELGAGQYVPGFEEGIIGMEVGEKKNVDVTFPENYYENLAGKKVVFEITVQKLYREVK